MTMARMHNHSRDLRPSGSTAASLNDPVCGMSVRGDSPHRGTHAGVEYRFCSEGCLSKFRSEPEKYASGSAKRRSDKELRSSADYTCPMHPEVRQKGPGSCPKCGMALEPVQPALSAAQVEYTCPMHPEIVRDEPGSCPICGMALEPRTARGGAEEESPELRDMTRRFWLAALFTVPLVIIAMGDLLPGRPISQLLSMRARTMLELGLATPVCLWAAWPFYVRFVQSIRNRSLNMFTLIGLGVSVAYVYSVVAALLPDIFPLTHPLK